MTPVGPEILVKADRAYGPDERHKLDVCRRTSRPKPAPIVIFVAYVRGNKTTPGTPFFQNIAGFWVRNGIVR